MRYRIEKDSMGPVKVPGNAYYGAATQRAVINFPISGLTLQPHIIHALALIKSCAAIVNRELGLLTPGFSDAIITAAGEIRAGQWNDQFPVDVFQTGSGTSTNMNVNEVIAFRANELLTGKKESKTPVHPNDHVNLGQSSNDVIPSALHIAALVKIKGSLLPAIEDLFRTLDEKAAAFADIPKIGRTHLQDAVPLYLGQEFKGYSRQIQMGGHRIETAGESLAELALGGTAVGNGLNTHPEFAGRVIARISRETRIDFKEARDHFEAQGARDAIVEMSGALKTLAVGLVKIANDIRWLASGPRCGIGEIQIPELQPGSSIMPGKINPVIPEAILQVAAQVMGNDTTIMMGGQAGTFELNVMIPVMGYNLQQSIDLLASAAGVFSGSCIAGITADEKRCREYIDKSLALATFLVPRIGYDRAADLARRAYESGETIPVLVRRENILPEEEIEALFTWQ